MSLPDSPSPDVERQQLTLWPEKLDVSPRLRYDGVMNETTATDEVPCPKLTALLTEPTIFDDEDDFFEDRPTSDWADERLEGMLADRCPEGW